MLVEEGGRGEKRRENDLSQADEEEGQGSLIDMVDAGQVRAQVQSVLQLFRTAPQWFPGLAIAQLQHRPRTGRMRGWLTVPVASASVPVCQCGLVFWCTRFAPAAAN